MKRIFIFNTDQFLCSIACLHKYFYWRNEVSSRKEQAWGRERVVDCSTTRRKYLSNYELLEFFL